MSMSRKIVTSFLIGKNYLEVIANEMIDNNCICLHNDRKESSDSKNRQVVFSSFIKKSIQEIEEKTLLKLEKINLIFDDYTLDKNLQFETKILDKTFQFNKTKNSIPLSEKNYWEFQNSVKNDLLKDKNNQSQKLISLIPNKFLTKDFQQIKNESFSEFPNGKLVSEIKCYFSASYIANNFYEDILNIFSLVNIKFDNIILLSHLSFYKFNGMISNKLTFTLDIQNEKSVLLTSINKIVISTNQLKFSFYDLVEKVSKDFNISKEIANNLLLTYGKVDIKEDDKKINDIIYVLNDNHHFITLKDLQNCIKSFLKTITIEAKKIIEMKLDKYDEFDINIVGKMEKIEHIDLYCAKYFCSKNVISNSKNNEMFYNWNHSYRTNKSLIRYADIVLSKIESLSFVKNNKTQNVIKKQNVFKFGKKKLQMAII